MTKGSFNFELFSVHSADGDTLMHFLILSKDIWVSVMVFHGLHIIRGNRYVTALIILRKQIHGVCDISDRLAKSTATRVYVTRICINLFWHPNIQQFDLVGKITLQSFLL